MEGKGMPLYQIPSEKIYEDPSEYREFIEDVISKSSVTEKVLAVKHPDKGLRRISTSTTVMYDAQQNFQGILSLGRDVTHVYAMEKRYRRIKKWFVPLIVVLGNPLLSACFGDIPTLQRGTRPWMPRRWR